MNIIPAYKMLSSNQKSTVALEEFLHEKLLSHWKRESVEFQHRKHMSYQTHESVKFQHENI